MSTHRTIFGTDGIRGKANEGNLTAEMTLKVGMAVGSFFTRGDHRHKVIIGKDTRLSGYLIESALTAGFCAVGMDVILVGPLPTPAVAMLTRSMRADLGVMISASHNPYYDNGIKLFGPDGYKLSDQAEQEIEQRISIPSFAPFLAKQDAIGKVKRLDDAVGRYIEFVKNTFPKRFTLEGLRIVIDCAHGAAYHIGATIFSELGAHVIPLGISPDGFNINAGCGSTYPQLLAETVLAHQADIGIALDGDADRIIVVDEKGRIVDGDQLLAVIAASWQSQGLLRGDGIVTTAMSNAALEHYLHNLDLHLVRTKIGDRYVSEAMRERRYNVGGEQSGHIILSDYSTTGDALVAALQILSVIVNKEAPVSQVTNVFTPFPQIIRNIRYQGTPSLDNNYLRTAITQAEDKLKGHKGRLLVRPSGTEPLLRIMAEGEDEDVVKNVTEELAHTLEKLITHS